MPAALATHIITTIPSENSIFPVDDEDRSSHLGGVDGSHFTDWAFSPALNYTYIQSKHIFLNQRKQTPPTKLKPKT